jgi:hypothetical protein
MSKQIIYSILQYKHSPILREAINVGVLFYFPESSKKIHFHYTDHTRIKPIYQNIDTKYFQTILKIIQGNIEKYTQDIYAEALLTSNFKDFISVYILKNDDTVLQFSEAYYAVNSFSSNEKAVDAFINLLLPFSKKKETEVIKHDDHFIIKKVKTRLLLQRPEIEKHLLKDLIIKTEDVSLKFDIAWKNGSTNLVHPISFDLQDEHAIQRKTAENCSYLNWLNNYTKLHNYRIDILFAEPQNEGLIEAYQKSVKLIENVDSNKKLVKFNEIDDYTDKAAKYLLSDQQFI